jgi:hypothetical protein
MYAVHNANISREATILDVPFVPQRHSWDCSLACVAMLLCYGLRPAADGAGTGGSGAAVAASDAGTACYEAVRAEQRRASPGTVAPLWTIDVALLLDATRHGLLLGGQQPVAVRDGIRAIAMFTSCLGVNPAHSSVAFYQDTLEDDRVQVEQSFKAAEARKITCALHVLTEEEMAEQLLTGSVAFVCMVDATRFRCAVSRACADGISAAVVDCVTQCACALRLLGSCCHFCGCAAAEDAAMPFAGHFVVLVGYDPASRLFIVRNPAAKVASMCSCTAEALGLARSSAGTDHDTIRVTFSC